ncbi:MAG: hypothetical protein RMY28_009275 [Nostoc sp. ChiSLP01]|nr:hypothetical protein [Nostoc sp. CmiSLP01]MDZ8285252.1 hypothetical protein [Nostoc sp. ChiSLP01]
MTHQIYTLQQLQPKSLAELKAIYSQLGASVKVADKRSKSAWAKAIIAHQSSQSEITNYELRITNYEVDGDDVTVNGQAIASITIDESHLTQPWVVKIDGVEVHRNGTWAQCYNYVRWHHKNGTLAAPATDDYLFHEDIQPTIKLPKVGDTYSTSGFVLRCIQVAGDYATVWNVYSNGLLGEIKMDYHCFWHHTLTFELFSTPQEAIADLYSSLQEYKQSSSMNIPQYEIYDYGKECNVCWKCPESGLPQRIFLNSKHYCYLDNPGIWVEEKEFCNIINSHAPTIANYSPENRIWKVYDAVDEDTVINELAFVIANFFAYEQSVVVQWIKTNTWWFRAFWEQVKEASLPPRPIYGMAAIRPKSEVEIDFNDINIDEWKKVALVRNPCT